MNTNSKLTCGQALIKLLEQYQVDTVFGIPGVHTLDLYKGLDGSSIKHVLTRHEQGAGFMADGYARVTGKPGVCFTITGPGVTNIATAVGQAYSDSIPMLVISSVNNRESMGKGRGELHETKDQRGIMAPITELSVTAYEPDQIPKLIAQAFSIFNSQRPRPVFIEIPLDVMSAVVDESWHIAANVDSSCDKHFSDNSALINASAALLKDASNPVIIAGGGAISASDQIKQLAEQLGAAVFTSVAAKGLLPAKHPLYAGSTLCVAPSWQYISDADVVIAIGTELSETDIWCEKLPIKGQLIRIDIDPNKLNDLYPAKVAILSDAQSTLNELLDAFADVAVTDIEQTADALVTLKSTIINDLDPLQLAHKRVLDVVQQGLPSHAFVSTDMTQLAYTGNFTFNVSQPRSWLHPAGYGTLGYALPAAIGAKCGAKNRPGLVIVGDGGILYTIQELATAAEEISSPLVVLLWNNDSLGQIRDDMVAQGIAPIGVSPKNPDYVKLAQGFGCNAYKPDSLDKLETDLRTAFEYQGVTLIQVDQAITNL
jgi:5-guanidino-2-oxopentanoate decarboxylase